jgi:thioredoxin-related protein
MKKIYVTLLVLVFATFSLQAQGLQEINLTDAVTGKVINIQSELKGKGLILIFHSLDCPFAKMYEARLIALRSKYQNQGFMFMLVNTEVSGSETDKTTLRSYIDESGMNMSYLIDDKQELAKYFKITKIPEVILLTSGAAGPVLSYRGALDNNPQAESAASQHYLDKAIDQLLKGEIPSPSQVRAVGCNVRTY